MYFSSPGLSIPVFPPLDAVGQSLKHRIKKELSICQSLLCLDLVSFPMLSQIKPKAPLLVVPFRQFLQVSALRAGLHLLSELSKFGQRWNQRGVFRKGTNGVSPDGVTANFMYFDRGTFGVAYFYIPRSARAYMLPRSVTIHYFCSGPISVDPSCPQPISAFSKFSQHQNQGGLSLLLLLVLLLL